MRAERLILLTDVEGVLDSEKKLIPRLTVAEARALWEAAHTAGAMSLEALLGTPTAFDRILATRFGVEAIDAVHAGDGDVMVALQAGEINRVPLIDAVGVLKTVPPELFEVAEVFFG